MKTILVTGGNRGIGLEICRQLDELGHRVIMGSRDLTKGEMAARSISSRVLARQLDVTDEQSIQNLYRSLESEAEKLDVLINNAGIGTRFEQNDNSVLARLKNVMETRFTGAWNIVQKVKPVFKMAGVSIPLKGAKSVSLSSVRQVMETNFYGPWRMVQVFLPLLLKSEEGRIINISSGMGELKSLAGDYPAYRLSKSSLNALTILLSNELCDEGIKVNSMCPGWVRTDMGGPDAPRTVSQGADTAVWLAIEPDIPSGKFFRDRNIIDW